MPLNLSNHKAIDAYYTALATYHTQDVTHEQATRLAFSTLLDAVSKTIGWTLVLEQNLSNRKRPDGTLQDSFKIPRGYWEAKDTNDDLDAEIKVNESLTLAGIPAECFAYRLGNRSALEWVIDQYQVSTDKRSGITSDPNRADDEEYITRLIGRVVTVSVETVELVQALPPVVVEEIVTESA